MQEVSLVHVIEKARKGFETIDTKATELVESCKLICQDKQFSLDERWDLFLSIPKQHTTSTCKVDFEAMSDNELYGDAHRCQDVDLYISVDEPEAYYDDAELLDIIGMKEEMMQKWVSIVHYDW